MKKTILITLVTLFLFTFNACTAKDTSADNNSQSKNIVEEKSKISEEEINNTSENEKSTDSNPEEQHEIEHLTADTFREKVFDYKNNQEWLYEGEKPCIIDFYADWCQPCKKLSPILKELSQEYAGEVIFYKVDTEEEKELASTFGIRSIPSILFVPSSGKPQMAKGLLPKENLKNAISEVLNVED